MGEPLAKKELAISKKLIVVPEQTNNMQSISWFYDKAPQGGVECLIILVATAEGFGIKERNISCCRGYKHLKTDFIANRSANNEQARNRSRYNSAR